MGLKVKLLVLVFIVSLFSLAGVSSVSFGVESGDKSEKTVTYDYYVVARAYSLLMPVAPSLASSPRGFQFTVDPPVFNFRNITTWGGRQYLYDGFAYSPYTNMSRLGSGATVNITNLLGYDITILDLTVELTEGTCTKRFFFDPAGEWFFNSTTVVIDTLDNWLDSTPVEFRDKEDEVDYNTGEIVVDRLVDGDRYNKICFEPYFGESNQGPGTLLKPDWLGDANATGHVATQYARVGKFGNYTGAPITLAAGATFTEYFGVLIFGDAEADEQINGTIRLALTYEVPPGVPIPSFTVTPSDPRINETTTFDASASTDDDGTIEAYQWDFGDGTNATGVIANHTYASAGQYKVTLTVTDNDGKINYEEQTVAVRFAGSPVASYTFSPQTPKVNQTVTFNASDSFDPDGTIVSYRWDFGDGDVTTVTNPVISHAFKTPRTYSVSLTVTDDASLTDTTSKQISVKSNPVASFTYSPTTPSVEETVTFNATLSTPNGGEIESYSWDFGDGNITTVGMSSPVITHTFASAGQYEVILNVTDSEGLWDTAEHSLTVSAATEIPWLWIGVGVVAIVVVVAVAVVLRRRK